MIITEKELLDKFNMMSLYEECPCKFVVKGSHNASLVFHFIGNNFDPTIAKVTSHELKSIHYIMAKLTLEEAQRVLVGVPSITDILPDN